MKIRRLFSVLLCAAAMLFAKLTVERQGDNFLVKRDGKVLIDSVAVKTGIPMEQAKVRSSSQTLADGTRVWERWCEERENRFRLEVAERADGAVEITMAGEIEALNPNRLRQLWLTMPKGLLVGREYQALDGNGRGWRPVTRKFEGKASQVYRWLACDGLIFDFNPIGPTDYCMMYQVGAIKGQWGVFIKDGAIHLVAGTNIHYYGGYTGAKIVLREGTNEDYDRLHSMRTYRYNQHLVASRLYSFGAVKFGKMYTAANLPFDARRGFGWADGLPAPTASAGAPEGAYYAHVRGKGRRTFRIAGLENGFHIVTVGAGNYDGAPNAFRIAVNGESLAAEVTVKPKTARTFARAVHVRDGKLDIALDGDFLLSTIAVQPLIYDSEDFSFLRGPWVADGYEPGTIYRNENYRPAPFFPVAAEELVLPVPGTELPAHPREPERPAWHQDLSQPKFDWLRHIHSVKLLGHSATMAELDDPAILDRFLDQLLKDKNYTSIELSGMHTRHTYFSHLERGKAAVGRIVQAVHKRGLKLIDHHSTTILWNCDGGPRVLAERLTEVGRASTDQLPTFQFCLTNPIYRQMYFDYIVDLVKLGVDGFQLDELNFWPHSCACQYCRAEFTRATGCQLPMNECDPSINNPDSELWRRWTIWRDIQVTNCYLELRRRTAAINPDLVLRNYTTHWGYIARNRRTTNLGWDLFDQSRALDWVGTEVMTRNVIQTSRSLLPYRRTQNIFNLAYGMPVDAWYYVADWPSAYFAWGVANMTNQTGMMPSSLVRPEGAPDFDRFAALPHNMKRVGTDAVAEIALLFSPDSRDWNRLVSYSGELYGLAQTMERLHIPYEFLGAMSLDQKHLAKYKALVVSGAGCLTDAQIQAIRAFAEQGGMVYLTTVAGLYDQYGTPRKAWPFADLFGFSPRAKSPAKIAQLSAHGRAVKPAKPVGGFLPPRTKGDPLRITVPCGKGKIVYCSLAIASCFCSPEPLALSTWNYDPDRALEALFQAEVADLFAPFRHWTIDAPKKVFTSIWREADGPLVVHLLNGLGSCMKPGDKLLLPAPVPAFPPVGQDITFTIPAPKCREALAYSPEFEGARPLRLAANPDGTATVSVPKGAFQTYLLIRIR